MKRRASVLMIECQGRVLVLLRAVGGPKPNTFCFPGGHAEEGEDAATTAARELQEETGLLLDPSTFTLVGTHELEAVILTAFRLQLEQDTFPVVTLDYEHMVYLWVDPKDAWVQELPLTGRVIRETLKAMR